MPNTFFATDADLLQIARWLLEEPGMQVFERASRPDEPNRRFLTVAEVAESFAEPGRNLSAWLETTGACPQLRHIEFEPDTQRLLGAKGRTLLESPAVIDIRRDNDQGGCLGASHISCWSEKGAHQRSMYSEDVLNSVDWKALRSIVARLQRKLTKASPAKLRSYPIMPDAFRELSGGKLALWNWGAACTYPAPHITLG